MNVNGVEMPEEPGRSSLDPLVAALEAGIAPRMPTLWRRAIAASVLLSALSFLAGVVMFTVIYKEGHTRERQFCEVQFGALRDKQRQASQTAEFLKTDAGRKRTGLNDYIRKISYPRLLDETKKGLKSVPPVCRPYEPPKLTPAHR